MIGRPVRGLQFEIAYRLKRPIEEIEQMSISVFNEWISFFKNEHTDVKQGQGLSDDEKALLNEIELPEKP